MKRVVSSVVMFWFALSTAAAQPRVLGESLARPSMARSFSGFITCKPRKPKYGAKGLSSSAGPRAALLRKMCWSSSTPTKDAA